jgi:hypothetical protein
MLLALSLLHGAAAQATTIVFDNLDPSPSPFLYSNGGSWTGNFNANTYATTSTTFVPSASGQLDELALGLTVQDIGGSTTGTLTLHDDIGGLPGNQLWQANASVPLVFGQLAQLTNIAGPTLNMGQTYWLTAAAPTDGFTLHGWYSNNQGDTGPIISAGNFFASTVRCSLQVGVITVPEPTSVALSAGGAALVVVSLRRRAGLVTRRRA